MPILLFYHCQWCISAFNNNLKKHPFSGTTEFLTKPVRRIKESSLVYEGCFFFPFLILCSSSVDIKVQHEPLTPCSSSCISLQHARFQEHVVLVVPPLLLLLLLHGASGDKLWMQRKSCKICCIFHYLHVKGHKSSSVKSAIKK